MKDMKSMLLPSIPNGQRPKRFRVLVTLPTALYDGNAANLRLQRCDKNDELGPITGLNEDAIGDSSGELIGCFSCVVSHRIVDNDETSRQFINPAQIFVVSP
jgi:hypothetical protein